MGHFKTDIVYSSYYFVWKLLSLALLKLKGHPVWGKWKRTSQLRSSCHLKYISACIFFTAAKCQHGFISELWDSMPLCPFRWHRKDCQQMLSYLWLHHHRGEHREETWFELLVQRNKLFLYIYTGTLLASLISCIKLLNNCFPECLQHNQWPCQFLEGVFPRSNFPKFCFDVTS